ncbi:MAG: hypothetical protein DPW18_09465 [Chloroflexi bacterium]|nr:hypothetical protein [Chloroflexota bacterium]MDL1943501.1 GNAT family N-acetyltransferase [Chloroflexi bacterium CFX2]
MTLQLMPASQYTIEELAGIYNQTRVDYLIPMPMNGERLAEYVHDFDIDLDLSMVALMNGNVAGLGMLGVRGDECWVTRLGVLPNNRRVGIGENIVRKMLEISKTKGTKRVNLEVINGNEKAGSLFKKLGFQKTMEYLVLRRAPGHSDVEIDGQFTPLEKGEALDLLRASPRQSWVNDVRSMSNAADMMGMRLAMGDGSRGWMLFRKKAPTLTHIILHTEHGDSEVVGHNLLQHLHSTHSRFDTYAENIASTDKHVPAFLSMGYFEAFRRTEMILDL